MSRDLLIVACISTLLLLQGFADSHASALSGDAQNIVFVVWDGMQRNHLYEMLAKQELPNLQALIDEGQIVNLTIDGHATDTLAGHAEMLTGYPPFLTGVQSNEEFSPIPKGYAIFERLETHYGKDNIVTIMLTGKSRLGGQAGAPFSNAVQSLDYLEANNLNGSIIGQKAINYLDAFASQRFFLFVHFSEPDVEGHLFGENSKEYDDSVKLLDLWLGKIVSKLKEANMYEKTAVYVTTDHGFSEGGFGHPSAPEIFLVTNDRTPMTSGTQADIAPTLLARLNINPCLITITQPSPPLFGRPLTQGIGFSCFSMSVIATVAAFIALTVIVKKLRKEPELRHPD